jgi:hypothetical protein
LRRRWLSSDLVRGYGGSFLEADQLAVAKAGPRPI